MPPPPKPWETNPSGTGVVAAVGASGTSGTTAISSLPTTSTVSSTLGMNRLPRASGLGGYGSSYGSGMSSMYGSGMGSMYGSGMGGMYGGMGGMYGGMGGMYGGMGMGMGMGGMGMLGMPGMGGDIVDQRGFMGMMMLSRCVEMFGMLTNVIQMVLGSVVQFMTSYMGLSQQYNQLHDEDAEGAAIVGYDDAGNPIPASHYSQDGTFVSRGGRRRAKRRDPYQGPQTVRELLWSLLKRLLLVAVVYFTVTRVYRVGRQGAAMLKSMAAQHQDGPSLPLQQPLGPSQHMGGNFSL